MAEEHSSARARLQSRGLRATGARLAVLTVLERGGRPLSHSEILRELGSTDWDPTTVYRNLVKLAEAGVAQIVTRAGGMDRYALAEEAESEESPHRTHPHFVCRDCGEVSCLPSELTVDVQLSGRWGRAVQQAALQFKGECPSCFERVTQKETR